MHKLQPNLPRAIDRIVSELETACSAWIASYDRNVHVSKGIAILEKAKDALFRGTNSNDSPTTDPPPLFDKLIATSLVEKAVTHLEQSGANLGFLNTAASELQRNFTSIQGRSGALGNYQKIVGDTFARLIEDTIQFVEKETKEVIRAFKKAHKFIEVNKAESDDLGSYRAQDLLDYFKEAEVCLAARTIQAIFQPDSKLKDIHDSSLQGLKYALYSIKKRLETQRESSSTQPIAGTLPPVRDFAEKPSPAEQEIAQAPQPDPEALRQEQEDRDIATIYITDLFDGTGISIDPETLINRNSPSTIIERVDKLKSIFERLGFENGRGLTAKLVDKTPTLFEIGNQEFEKYVHELETTLNMCRGYEYITSLNILGDVSNFASLKALEHTKNQAIAVKKA